MGQTYHSRIPVFDSAKKKYVGAVTFHTLSRAVSRNMLNESLVDCTIQPARVRSEDSLASIIQTMQDSGITVAFVYDGDRMVGMITLSDLIERIMGIKV